MSSSNRPNMPKGQQVRNLPTETAQVSDPRARVPAPATNGERGLK
jgi:hypothetical protein